MVANLSCNKQPVRTADEETKEESDLSAKRVTPAYIPVYCADLPNPCDDPACARYYNCDEDITYVYAGKTITYEVSSGLLRFNSASDVGAVLDQLDTDYETYNSNYENQYPNYTADQLDIADSINNFDEFKKYKEFENRFTGFISKRKQIESTENAWLTNNFTGTDPDDIDLTYDDALNTIFSSNCSFKVGNSVYQLKSDGIYVNGVLQDNGSTARLTDCKSNKKDRQRVDYTETRRFKLKVAIHSIVVRSGIRGKVVHFKKKNGKWKRGRADMAVGCGGKIYQGDCTFISNFADRKPSSGFKKRRQLATRRHNAADIPTNATIWKTYSGEIASYFDTPELFSRTLVLNF